MQHSLPIEINQLNFLKHSELFEKSKALGSYKLKDTPFIYNFIIQRWQYKKEQSVVTQKSEEFFNNPDLPKNIKIKLLFHIDKFS